jgi:tripartite-type tricarboxylate transporter receptor subunit TctC
VPALGEFIPGFESITVAGIGAPRGTPADIVEKLNTEINAGLKDPKLVDRLDALGSTALGGSASDFANLIARETNRWSQVIRTSGIKIK